jgi:hypothetical protein
MRMHVERAISRRSLGDRLLPGMGGTVADKYIQVAEFKAGDLREHDLQREIDEAWKALLADPRARADVAADLGVELDQLGDGQEAPVQFATTKAHMTGGELALVVAAWAAKDIFIGMISDEVKSRLRKLVEKRLLPMLRRRPGGRSAVGPMVEPDADRD